MKLNPERIRALMLRKLGHSDADHGLAQFQIAMRDIQHRADVARRMAVASVRCGAPVREAQATLNATIDGLERELRQLTQG